MFVPPDCTAISPSMHLSGVATVSLVLGAGRVPIARTDVRKTVRRDALFRLAFSRRILYVVVAGLDVVIKSGRESPHAG